MSGGYYYLLVRFPDRPTSQVGRGNLTSLDQACAVGSLVFSQIVTDGEITTKAAQKGKPFQEVFNCLEVFGIF